MQLLPSISRPTNLKPLLSLLPHSTAFIFHTFSLSLLETHPHPNHFNQILSHAITSGRFTDPFVSSKLLRHSLSSHPLSFSLSLFSQIQNPNLFAWNFILQACSQSSYPLQSLTLYNLMRRCNIIPDKYAFPFVLKACGKLWWVEKGLEIHCLSAKLGLELDVFVQNSLISMYFQCGFVEFGHRVFDNMPGLVRDVVSWNSVVSGYVQSGCYSNALKVFVEMLGGGGVRPNEMTLVSALTACGRTGLLVLGTEIHGFSVVSGFVLDVFLGSSLVDIYAKCGQLEDARKVFDRIPSRNVVCWTSMIAGYVQSDLFKDAIDLFREMQAVGVNADSQAVACVISACGHSGALHHGRWVHSYCERNHIELNLSVKNALIDMYSKCGDVEKALEIFHGLTTRDVFSWTVMISSLAMNGHSERALHLFSQMEVSSDVRPNDVTFLGVLSACSHGGFVDKGFYYLEAMSKQYGLIPRLEHYGCMVDLLGRANLLVEALMFIKSLPIQPDVVMWRSLLFACRTHGNIELAEFAANRIEELEPTKGGARVILSNVYASASRWSDVKRVRKNMFVQGARKQPGCSFIEVDGLVHEFLVGDSSHPQISDISETIIAINKIQPSDGLYPNISYDQEWSCTRSDNLEMKLIIKLT